MIKNKNIKNFIFIGLLIFLIGIFGFNLKKNIVQADLEADLVKEFLFTVQGSAGDAIGIKVMENPQRLTPLTWYQENVLNPGNPSTFMVDGYYALREGRTVYVGATNVSGTSNQNISSYIYIISYNEGASPETVNIFNQLLENFTFNNNLTSADQRGEIQRDLFRIYDLDQIKNKLDSYYTQYGFYPRISSGSYQKGKSYSPWPSWQYTLGRELGQSLPVDPINRFYGSCANCPDNPQQSNYQCDGTCYNPLTQEFVHPNNSHVYSYYTPDDDCSGSGYELSANLEYYPFSAIPPLPAVKWLGDNEIIISSPDTNGSSNYVVSQGLGECGNGILDACEECEIIGGEIVPSGKTCANLGLGSGTLECSNCRWAGCDKRTNGEGCDFDSECLSGHCSPDGVCCNTACLGLCQTCVGGTCSLVNFGQDPRNVCSDDDPCLTGSCDGFGACALEDTGTACGTCQYCSVNGQCLNTPFGEDYNDQCPENSSNCEAGYCDGFGSCTYYPEGFVCNNCKQCSAHTPPNCSLVPAGTDWGFNYYCNGAGDFTCYSNWGNCDGDWNTGCETNLLIDPENCGSCDNVCSSPTPYCVNGSCESSGGGAGDCVGEDYGTPCGPANGNTHCNNNEECVCQDNYGDCNSNSDDGCEVNLLDNNNHCGSCDNVCSSPTPYCVNGSCESSGGGGGSAGSGRVEYCESSYNNGDPLDCDLHNTDETTGLAHSYYGSNPFYCPNYWGCSCVNYWGCHDLGDGPNCQSPGFKGWLESQGQPSQSDCISAFGSGGSCGISVDENPTCVCIGTQSALEDLLDEDTCVEQGSVLDLMSQDLTLYYDWVIEDLGGDCVGEDYGTPCGPANGNMHCNNNEECVCQDNYGDCNSNPDDGCETDLLTSWLHCGACADSCNVGEDCISGECEPETGGGGQDW